MSKKFTLIKAFVLFAMISGAQPVSNVSPVAGDHPRTCGTPAPSEEWNKWFNERALEFISRNSGSKKMANYTIPVIVHVIHGGQAKGTFPNLTQAQINSQLKVLNQDFAGTGYNVSNVPAPFAPLVANTSISFSMALLDTSGNLLAEPGIERINYVSRGWGAPTTPNSSADFQTYMNTIVKPNTIWDPRRYLNIWISDRNFNTQLLGYATFPAGSGLTGVFGTGSASDDGVWIWSMAFGDIGTLAQLYNKGRTATHEIGHWLGLRHTWGDSNCGNDFCNDTPTQQDMNYGCPNFPKVTCSNGPNGDMFMNFMDYCDDACMYMFTHNQNTRMQTAMNNGTYRKDLTASSATLCTFVPEAPVVSFQLQTDNCIQSEALTINDSQGKPAPSYSWSSIPDAGVTFSPSASVKDPTLIVTYPGNYEIVLTASNSAGSSSASDYMYFADCNNVAGLKKQSVSSAIRIQPQPASELVTIGLDGFSGSAVSVTVHNCLGQQVRSLVHQSAKGRELALNVSALPAGVYTITVAGEGSVVTKRMIVSR